MDPTTELLLARHGNTFGPGDRVVWVGAQQDLALVDRGREQAAELARSLVGTRPVGAIYCASLARTREHAAIVAETLELPEPVVDDRLGELDYGSWSGLTNEEIRERFGSAELEEWRQRGRWPASAGFGSSEAVVRGEAAAFVADLRARHTGERVLAITSNGRLRYFLDLVEGALDARRRERAFSVATGHVGKLMLTPSEIRVAAWNVTPTPEVFA